MDLRAIKYWRDKGGDDQPAALAELEEFRLRSVHPVDLRTSTRLIKEAEEPPGAMGGFADEARNKLDKLTEDPNKVPKPCYHT